MARLVIDDNTKPENSVEILDDYSDHDDRQGVHLRLDFKGQKTFLHFYLNNQDARELAKKILDMV